MDDEVKGRRRKRRRGEVISHASIASIVSEMMDRAEIACLSPHGIGVTNMMYDVTSSSHDDDDDDDVMMMMMMTIRSMSVVGK